MKKIIMGNTGCANCLSPCKTSDTSDTCEPFINEMINKGLPDCCKFMDETNYVYSEKENEMKLTKIQKQALKDNINYAKGRNGFIHRYEGGITVIYIPSSKAKDNRMFQYGQSVCNESDKYKKKLGIYLAFKDLFTNNKLMPIEMIYGLTESSQFVELVV